jgi:hypothetical protein
MHPDTSKDNKRKKGKESMREKRRDEKKRKKEMSRRSEMALREGKNIPRPNAALLGKRPIRAAAMAPPT